MKKVEEAVVTVIFLPLSQKEKMVMISRQNEVHKEFTEILALTLDKCQHTCYNTDRTKEKER